MIIDVSKFSKEYIVKKLTYLNIDEILEVCKENPQYYKYCDKVPTKDLILNDLEATPFGIDIKDKYYVGFYQENKLIAVMDLIRGYPTKESAFIGFFMMSSKFQGKNIGTKIVQETLEYLKQCAFKKVRLGMEKENPQSTSFWNKNGFKLVKETSQNQIVIWIVEKEI